MDIVSNCEAGDGRAQSGEAQITLKPQGRWPLPEVSSPSSFSAQLVLSSPFASCSGPMAVLFSFLDFLEEACMHPNSSCFQNQDKL